MKRPPGVLPDLVSAVRERVSAVAGQSERTIMLGTILMASAVSGAVCFVLTQYYSVDVISSLAWLPKDCFPDWGMKVGRHCFNDYANVLPSSVCCQIRGSPPQQNRQYPAGGLVPHYDLRGSRCMAACAAAGVVRLPACFDDRGLYSRRVGGSGCTWSRAGGGVRGVGRGGHSSVDGNRSGQLGGVRGADRAGVSGGAVPTAVGPGQRSWWSWLRW